MERLINVSFIPGNEWMKFFKRTCSLVAYYFIYHIRTCIPFGGTWKQELEYGYFQVRVYDLVHKRKVQSQPPTDDICRLPTLLLIFCNRFNFPKSAINFYIPWQIDFHMEYPLLDNVSLPGKLGLKMERGGRREGAGHLTALSVSLFNVDSTKCSTIPITTREMSWWKAR